MSYHSAFHNKIRAHNEFKPVVPVVDAHLHFVDFIQETDGMIRLVEAMDAGGVSKAVVFGIPLKKKWEAFEKRPPHYYLDDNSPCYYFTGTDEILADELLRLPAKARNGLRPWCAALMRRINMPFAT